MNIKIIATLVMLISVFIGPATTAHAELADKIVAIVNRKVITLYQLEQAQQQMAAEQGMSPEAVAEKRQELLHILVENEVIRQYAEESGILVSEEELNAALDDIKARNQLLSNDQLKDIVHQQGQVWEEFLEDIRKQIKMAKLINREVRSRVEVSEDAVAEYYQLHQDQFQSGSDTFRVRHIALKVVSQADVEAVKAQAVQLVQLLRDGADFEETVRQYSEDPSADKGGVLGTFTPGDLAPPYDIAFTLEEGEVSDPVRSDFGFHILNVQQRISAEQATFENARRAIRQQLYEEKFSEFYQQWIAELKERAYIEIKEL